MTGGLETEIRARMEHWPGLGYVQAYYAVRARRTLARRAPHRRPSGRPGQ